jgi:hypothetical protein
MVTAHLQDYSTYPDASPKDHSRKSNADYLSPTLANVKLRAKTGVLRGLRNSPGGVYTAPLSTFSPLTINGRAAQVVFGGSGRLAGVCGRSRAQIHDFGFPPGPYRQVARFCATASISRFSGVGARGRVCGWERDFTGVLGFTMVWMARATWDSPFRTSTFRWDRVRRINPNAYLTTWIPVTPTENDTPTDEVENPPICR